MRCGGKLGCMNDVEMSVEMRSARTQSNGLLGYLCQECVDHYASLFKKYSEANKQVHEFEPSGCARCGYLHYVWQHGVTEHRGG